MITHQTCNTYEQIPKVSAFTSIHELTLNTTSMFQKGITLHLKTNKLITQHIFQTTVLKKKSTQDIGNAEEKQKNPIMILCQRNCNIE